MKSLLNLLVLNLGLLSGLQAEEAAAAVNPVFQFLPFVLMFVVIYFLIIRPQKKKEDSRQEFLKNLSKGTEVITQSGILGTVTGITDGFVTLEVGENVKIKVLKSAIAGSLKETLAEEKK